MKRERSGAMAVLEGANALYLTLCVIVVLILVLLRGLVSGYRVGGVLLAMAVLAGFVAVVVLAAGDAVRRRWTRRSIVVVGGYSAAVVAIALADMLTS